MNKDNTKTEKKEKKGKLQLLVIFLLLAMLALGAGMLYQLMKDDAMDRLTRDSLALGGMLPGKTPEEISNLLSEKVEEGMVNIGIAAEPVFEKNGKKGRIGIENIAANHYSFRVTLSMDETREVVYESGLLDPGYYIEFVELNRKLQAGDYPATASIVTYSLDETEDEIAETRVKLVLHVMDGIFYNE